jgi:hypothetical protein
MTIRTFAVLLAAAGVALSARAADPPVAPGTLRTPVAVKASESLRRTATLTIEKIAGIPGERKTFTAVLKENAPGNPPLVGKQIFFKIVPGPKTDSVNGGVTDANGRAVTTIALPELVQGNYKLEAGWKGDGQHPPASGEANLLMIKAPTKVDMDFVYGSYKNEPGKFASFSAKVLRTHDGQVLTKPIVLTVNGSSRTMPASEYHNTALPDAPSWAVKVQFEGDGAYAASAAEKTFVKPK